MSLIIECQKEFAQRLRKLPQHPPFCIGRYQPKNRGAVRWFIGLCGQDEMTRYIQKLGQLEEQ